MGINEFLSQAPKFIVSRYNSLNKYVWEMLVPDDLLKIQLDKKVTKAEKRKEMIRLKEISEEAAIVCFIFVVNRFFIEGSDAAIQAVDTLSELNIKGFYIGNSYFSERNDKVIQGQVLAKNLMNSLGDSKAKKLIQKSLYISDIIKEYQKLI